MSHSESATLLAIRDSRDQLLSLCTPLDDAGWQRRTALPAWDVRDVVAHLGSLEALLLGRLGVIATPEPERWAAHVHNPLGALNQVLVEERRGWPAARVLEEFREAGEARLHQLEAVDEAALDAEVEGLVGRRPLRGTLGMRLWDYVIHELDVSDALGQAFRLRSPGAVRVLDEQLQLVPRTFAKAGAGEGDSILVELAGDGELPRTAGARVHEGRGRATDLAAGEATLHLRASPTAFLRVARGRRVPAAALGDGGRWPLATRASWSRSCSTSTLCPDRISAKGKHQLASSRSFLRGRQHAQLRLGRRERRGTCRLAVFGEQEQSARPVVSWCRSRRGRLVPSHDPMVRSGRDRSLSPR